MSFYRRDIFREDQLFEDGDGWHWIRYGMRVPVELPDELKEARRRDSLSIMAQAAMDLFVQHGWTPVGALEAREYEETRTSWQANFVVEYRLEVRRPRTYPDDVSVGVDWTTNRRDPMGGGWETVTPEAYLALCDKLSQPPEGSPAAEAPK